MQEKWVGLKRFLREPKLCLLCSSAQGPASKGHCLVSFSGHLAWIICSICLGYPAGSVRRGPLTGSPLAVVMRV